MILERGSLLNNRYRILEILGQGGMGSVYRALDENLGVEVAVKDNLFTTEEYARQFRREAVILANLRHANLPRVTDHFVIDGQGQYLVMDYIEGEDLRQRMDRAGSLSEEDAIVVGAAVCDALTYLDSRKPPIVHRDIKPGNIKITPQGQIFLVDFGLAKAMVGTQTTTTGARAMTPGYSPPEQYGAARTDKRSDIFSLGATLYAALTGSVPEDALARAMNQAELTPIRRLAPRVSKKLAGVIEKSLAVQPDDRYHDAEEFKQALVSCRIGRRNGEYTITPPPDLDFRQIPDEELPAGRQKALDLEPSPLPLLVTTHLEAGDEIDQDAQAQLPRRQRFVRRRAAWLLAAALFFIALGAGAYYFRPDLFRPWLAGAGRAIGLDLGQGPPAEPTDTPTVSSNNPLTEQLKTTTSQNIAVLLPTTALPPTPTKPLPASPTPTQNPTQTPTPTLSPTPLPTPLGGGALVAFASRRNDDTQIYIANVDGSGLRKLTSVPDGACQPEWAPDGARIVFVSPCKSNQPRYPGSSLYVISLDGTGLLPLPTVPGGDFDPSWSPDGKKIAFTSIRGIGTPQILVMNLEDNTVETISPKFIIDYQPSWSPDGQKIIFITERNSLTEIWEMDITGENPRKISASGSLLNSRPFYSPDMQFVIFTQLVGPRGVPRVVVAPVDAEEYIEYRIITDQIPMRDARYSPDGYWMIFEGWPDPSNHEVYIVAVNGSSRRVVTNDPGVDFDPAWMPIQ